MAYGRRRANGRFYLFLIVLAAIALGVFFVIRYSTGGTVDHGSLPLNKTVSAVIVRDEEIATAESYGNIKFLAAEGEAVSSGEKVAEIYKWGYNENIVQDLLTLQQQIRSYQVETIFKDIMDSELNAIETSIRQKADEVAKAIRGESGEDVLALEAELERLMSDRSDLLRNKAQPDDKLGELYAQEQALIESINALKGDALSTGAGLISFYFDGFEAQFNRTQLPNITAYQITSYLRGNLKPTTADAKKSLYRIVNKNRWYCVLVDKSTDQRLVEGETYSVVFDGYFDRPYTGTLVSAIQTQDGLVCALEIKDDIGPFLSVRKSNASIVRTFEGMRIPARTITERDGKQGVFVHANGNKQFVPLVVLVKNREYAIVRAADSSASLAEGMRVTAN